MKYLVIVAIAVSFGFSGDVSAQVQNPYTQPAQAMQSGRTVALGRPVVCSGTLTAGDGSGCSLTVTVSANGECEPGVTKWLVEFELTCPPAAPCTSPSFDECSGGVGASPDIYITNCDGKDFKLTNLSSYAAIGAQASGCGNLSFGIGSPPP